MPQMSGLTSSEIDGWHATRITAPKDAPRTYVPSAATDLLLPSSESTFSSTNVSSGGSISRRLPSAVRSSSVGRRETLAFSHTSSTVQQYESTWHWRIGSLTREPRRTRRRHRHASPWVRSFVGDPSLPQMPCPRINTQVSGVFGLASLLLSERRGSLMLATRRVASWRTEADKSRIRAENKDWTPPWALTFDLRERETDWTPENQAIVLLQQARWLQIHHSRCIQTAWMSQARLVKLFAAEQLEIDVLEAELRVAQLCLLIPQLSVLLLSNESISLPKARRQSRSTNSCSPCFAGSRIKTMKPELLAQLLQDPAIVATRLANLREALPDLDLASLAALAPYILLKVCPFPSTSDLHLQRTAPMAVVQHSEGGLLAGG